MTSLAFQQSFDSTSAAGAMSSWQLRGPVLLGCMLVGIGTSTANALPPEMVLAATLPATQTTAGPAVVAPEPAGAAIAELRRVSGLTWDQLARLFNVSRRSLHFWASGKPMAGIHEEHLHRLLAVIRKIDRGSASANRAALFGVGEDGIIPFDLLVAGHYGQSEDLLGTGQGRRVRSPKMSDEARAGRSPRPPEDLVGALQNRIHPTSGRLLAAAPIRIPGRK